MPAHHITFLFLSGAKKYYQKEGAELEESFPVVTEKEMDIFADEDSEEWPEDW